MYRGFAFDTFSTASPFFLKVSSMGPVIASSFAVTGYRMLMVKETRSFSAFTTPTQAVSGPETSSAMATPRDVPSVSKPASRENALKNSPCSPFSFSPAMKSARQARALIPFSGVLPWAGWPFITRVTLLPSSSEERALPSGPFQADAAAVMRCLHSVLESSITAVTSAMTTLAATPPSREVIFISPDGAKGRETV